jgi:hypothetical protein
VPTSEAGGPSARLAQASQNSENHHLAKMIFFDFSFRISTKFEELLIMTLINVCPNRDLDAHKNEILTLIIKSSPDQVPFESGFSRKGKTILTCLQLLKID